MMIKNNETAAVRMLETPSGLVISQITHSHAIWWSRLYVLAVDCQRCLKLDTAYKLFSWKDLTACSLGRHFSSLRPRHILIFNSHAGINFHSVEATPSLTAVHFRGCIFPGDPGWPTMGKLDSRIPVPLRKASALPALTPWQQPGSVLGIRFLAYSTFPDSFPLTVAQVLSPQ